MSDETEAAAHVAHVASQAADALTKTAAHTAAAVVEVAGEAHASMWPLVLSRLNELADALSEVKAEVVAVGGTSERTLVQATKTNGRMDAAESRLNSIELAARLDAALRSGRQAQRSDDLALVRGVRTFANEFWPLILGAALGGAGGVAFLWSLL